MPGHPFAYHGPPTVEVSVPVTKGQGLEWDPDNAGKVRPWSAGSATPVGVAHTDAAPAAANAYNNYAPLPRAVAAQIGPTETRVIYAANCAPGELLVAASDGRVTPAGATPAAATVIGRCTEPSGVTAGATARARLYI